MAKRPRDRYQTAAEVAAALEQAASGGLTGDAPVVVKEDLPSSDASTAAFPEATAEGFTGLDLPGAEDSSGLARKRRQRREAYRLVLLSAAGVLPLLGLALLLYLFTGRDEPRSKTAGDAPEPPGPARPVEVRRARAALKGHTDAVTALAFAGDGLLASASEDGDVRVWDKALKRCIHRLDHPGPLHALAFSPDGKTLAAAAGRTIHVWNLDDFTRRTRFDTAHPRIVRGLAFWVGSSDQVVTVGDGSSLQIWEIPTHQQPGGRFLPAEPWSVVCQPGGRRFAFGLANGAVRFANNDEKPEPVQQKHRGPVKALAYSPSSTALASGGADGIVRLWNATTGEPWGAFEGHRGEVLSLAFSSDGKELASASADGTVRLWGVESGKRRAVFHGCPRGIGAVAFTPDDRTLVSGERDGVVRLWDVPAAGAGRRRP
jgi:WD40 repeat protein